MKIYDLDISEFLTGDTKISEMGLVENPAIEVDWVYFNKLEQSFESYDDYPQAASDAACKAVRWAEENGWGDCLEATGKRRASQLCNREKISEETIARMASFARHLQYEDVPYDEGCGGLAVDSWGSRIGIEWASRKLEQIRNEKMSSCGCELQSEFVNSAMGITIGDYVSWTYAGRGEGDDRGRGQVKDIRVQGEVNVPGTDFTLNATPEKPVALIETIDGSIVGQYIDGDMRVIQKPEGFNDKGMDIYGYTTKYFWMCPFATELFNAMKNREEDPDILGMIRSAAVLADAIFKIEAYGLKRGYTTEDELTEASVLSYDFKDLVREIGELQNTSYDTTFMDGHISTIKSLVKEEDQPELEDLLEDGWIITEYKDAVEDEIINDFREQFNEQKLTEQQFYKIATKPNEPSILDLGARKRRFVYAIGPAGGPDLISTSREFCRRMMGKRQLVWRLEDIQLLSTQLNSEDRDYKIIPRPKNAPVDLFLYKGGANCRHRWMEVSLERDQRVYNNKEVAIDDAAIVLDAPAQAGGVNEPVQYGRKRDVVEFNEQILPKGFLKGLPVFEKEDDAVVESQKFGCKGVYQKVEYMGKEMFRICNLTERKQDEYKFGVNDEQRMLYAPTMIPNKLIRRYENGQEFYVRFSKDSIKRAAYKFLMEKRIDKVNLEHSDTKFKDVYLVESWISGKDDKIYDYGFSKEDVPEGSWIVGYKVYNDDVWDNYIKTGKIKGFSVEGLFEMDFKKSKQSLDNYIMEEIINILKNVK